jgi:hypothetical protein
MVSIEGENMRHVTWGIVEKVKSGDWGIGGNTLTVEDVRALAAGKKKNLRGGCLKNLGVVADVMLCNIHNEIKFYGKRR